MMKLKPKISLVSGSKVTSDNGAESSDKIDPADLPSLSFVVPAYNEESSIQVTIERIAKEARRLGQSFEIIIVDDGSSDATFDIAAGTIDQHPVRALRLSRNFGKESAMTAGLQHSKGQAVVILDADLQEPISYLEEMLHHYNQGYEMVYAVRKDREDEPYLKRLLVRGFYNALQIGSDVEIPADARDFRLMDRKVVDSILALPEKNRFMKGVFAWVGYRSKAIYIEMEKREHGQSKFGFKGLSKLAMTALTSYTKWPLQVWAGFGTLFASISLLYGSWALIQNAIWRTEISEYALLGILVFFIGGIQLIAIGIIGEYLARVFAEVKGRPTFIVAEDVHKLEKS